MKICAQKARPAETTILLVVVLGIQLLLISCGGGSSSPSPSGSATAVSSITITPASPSIAMNATEQFTATARNSSGASLTGITFAWSSSASSVATISSSGLATAVGTGTAQMTASANGVTSQPDTLTVTTAPALVSIAVTPADPSVSLGAQRQFTATGTFADNSAQNITTTVVWSSGTASVATVSNATGSNGLATSVAVGTSTITATSGSVSGQTTLTVTAVAGSGPIPVSNAIAFQSSTGTQAPDLLAVDGSGNIWVGSRAYGTMMRLQPGSATADCSAGCTLITKPNNALSGLAIDKVGNIWIADQAGGSVGFPCQCDVALAYINPASLAVTNVYPNNVELNSNLTLYGQAESGSIAMDNSGNVVVGGNAVFNGDGTLNYSLVLTSVDGAGTLVSDYVIPSTVITNAGGFYPIPAVDGSGNTWALFSSLSAPPFLLKYSPGSLVTPTLYTLPGGVIPLNIAFDSKGAAWVVTSTQIGSGSPGGTGILKISAAAPADCSSGCTSYASPTYLNYNLTGIAVDGADAAWVSGNVSFSSLGYNGIAATKITSGAATDCSSGCTSFINSQFLNTANVTPGGIAIDASGNVWLENYTNGSVVELPNIAADTVAPIVAQPR